MVGHGCACGAPCADAYIDGADGSNECPAGTVRIEGEAACRTAAAATGKRFQYVDENSDYPRGCYYDVIDVDVWLNVVPVGTGYSGYRLLCAVVTTGAPHAPTDTHTRRGPPHGACACASLANVRATARAFVRARRWCGGALGERTRRTLVRAVRVVRWGQWCVGTGSY